MGVRTVAPHDHQCTRRRRADRDGDGKRHDADVTFRKRFLRGLRTPHEAHGREEQQRPCTDAEGIECDTEDGENGITEEVETHADDIDGDGYLHGGAALLLRGERTRQRKKHRQHEERCENEEKLDPSADEYIEGVIHLDSGDGFVLRWT